MFGLRSDDGLCFVAESGIVMMPDGEDSIVSESSLCLMCSDQTNRIFDSSSADSKSGCLFFSMTVRLMGNQKNKFCLCSIVTTKKMIATRLALKETQWRSRRDCG